jgi:1-acyl-sn-glycerol-3-phosphate acyltransferase
MGRFYRPWIAWYGDMEMASHLWALLGLGTITVNVEFHPPIAAGTYPSRKALCEACHRIVAGGVASALSGREPTPELPLSTAPATDTRPTVAAAADLPVASAEA